jgi:hypothetical protein
MRDPQQVAAEFVADRQPYAVFIDNNLGSNREYLRELCHALQPLNKIWSAAVSIDVTDDPSLIRAMALAGCTGVFVGFESLTDENLADARKKTPKTADYSRRVLMPFGPRRPRRRRETRAMRACLGVSPRTCQSQAPGRGRSQFRTKETESAQRRHRAAA